MAAAAPCNGLTVFCGVVFWQLLHMTNGMSGQSRNPAVVRFMSTGQGEGTVENILAAERDNRLLEYVTLVDNDKVSKGRGARGARRDQNPGEKETFVLLGCEGGGKRDVCASRACKRHLTRRRRD
jgi:hypothetical protein